MALNPGPYLRDYNAISSSLPPNLRREHWGVYYDEVTDQLIVYAKGKDGQLVRLPQIRDGFPSDELVAQLILILSE